MAKTKQGTDMVEGVGGLSGDMFDADADFDFGEIGLEGLDLDLAAFDLGQRKAPVLYERAVDLARDIGPAIMAGERVDAVVSGNKAPRAGALWDIMTEGES